MVENIVPSQVYSSTIILKDLCGLSRSVYGSEIPQGHSGEIAKKVRGEEGGWIDSSPPSQLPEKPITALIATTIFHPISTSSLSRGETRLEAMHFALVGCRYFLPWW